MQAQLEALQKSKKEDDDIWKGLESLGEKEDIGKGMDEFWNVVKEKEMMKKEETPIVMAIMPKKQTARRGDKSGKITRELNKEPSLHCSSIYTTTSWSMLQQYVYLMSIHHASTSCSITYPHVFSLRLPCFLYVS